MDPASAEIQTEAAIARTTRSLWMIAGAMIAALALAYWATGLSLDFTKGWTMPGIILVLVAVVGVSRAGRWPTLAFGAEITAQNLTIMMTATLQTYAAAATSIPYRDAEFHALDAWLGFDWRAYLDFVAARPWLWRFEHVGYASMWLQFFFVIIAMVAAGRYVRLQQYTVALAIGLVITTSIFIVTPALGPYALLGLTPADFPDISPMMTFQHVLHLEAIRSGAMRVISLDNLQGLVSFPSFHTITAILFCWAVWPIERVRWGTIVLNGTLIASAPIEGAHYLVDIIAGAAIAPIIIVAAIAITERIARSPAHTRDPDFAKPATAEPSSG